MTATTPDLVVQVCPGQGPLVDVTDGQWVTVSESAVVDVSYRHGRNSEFDTFSAGTLTVTFEDRTRTFDPLNASGTYYGDLNPGMHVRVLARIGVTDYPRWRGFAESILTTNAKTTTFVTLTCSDAFKILNQTKLPQSVYETVVREDGPHLYWKLGESGPAAVDSSGNDNDGVYQTGLVEQAQTGIRPNGGASARYVSSSLFGAIRAASSGATLASAPVSIEFWAKSENITRDASSLDTYTIFSQGDPATSTNRAEVKFSLGPESSPVDRIIGGHNGGTYGNFILPGRLDDGLAHHVVLTSTSTSTKLYYDGLEVLVDSTSGSVGSANQIVGVAIGGWNTSNLSWPGYLSDVAYYDVELTAAQITEHYEAAVEPWDGDFAGARVTRILDEIGWPAGLRAIDPGEKRLGPARLNGMSALAYCQLVAQSEDGRFFIDKSGYATFHDAGRFLRETVENTSQYTFSDDEAGDAVYQGGNFSRDDTQVWNEAVITRDQGLPQTATDQTSVDAYGPRTYALTGLLHQSDALARGLAEQTVYRYKDPASRVTQLTLQPEVDAADWADLLALEIGYRVTVEQKPANTGTQIQLDQHVEHIAEQVNGDTWTLTFQLSPTDPHEDAYLIFDGVGATQGFDVGVFR